MANTTGKKFGGRTKGTKNKSTVELKKFINEFLQKNSETMQADYDELSPADRLRFFEKLISYVVPKQQSVSQKIDFNKLSEQDLDVIIAELDKTVTHD